MDRHADESASENEPTAASCPLGDREQVRNLVLVGINTGLSYLASPVLYVGVVHAALGEQLHASATVSNLPASAYLVMAALPLFVSWYFPRIAQLKTILIVCYAALATMSAIVSAVLLWPAPYWLRITALIIHGGVVGGARTVAVACEFEVLGRAVSEARRGTALGLAYGVGPVLAIVGALVSQLLLTGTLGLVTIPAQPFPVNFATLFAVSVPIMALGAFLSSRFIIPLPVQEASRRPFLQGVFGGLGQFLGRPVVRRSMLVGIVVLAGYQIISNLTLYTREVLGEAPAQFAGYQNAVRFSCKAVAGVLMGWLLTRTHPRAGVLVTACIGLAGVGWAIVASRNWFLLSFGLLGAGELFGIYLTNYLLCCAAPEQMRRYMAFSMLTLFPAAPAGALYGAITDAFKNQSEVLGFQLSFVTAALFITMGIGLALCLPRRPQPESREANRKLEVALDLEKIP
jgi:MFS family permease